MKRTLVVVAAVVGFATAASAATLTVFTTNTSDVAQTSFLVGDTILLKVTGDAQGGTDNAIHGELVYNAAVAGPGAASTQGNWFSTPGTLPHIDGLAVSFDQVSGGANPIAPNNQVQTNVIRLVAEAVGVSSLSWGGTTLDFFDVYSYDAGGISVPTGASFSVIPEPATAGLIGLGLLALVIGGRRRE